RLVLAVAVLRLQAPDQRILLAGDLVNVVVGEAAPPTLRLAAQLTPLTLEHVLIHPLPPCVRERARAQAIFRGGSATALARVRSWLLTSRTPATDSATS